MSSERGYEMACWDFEREKSLCEKTKRRIEKWRTCRGGADGRQGSVGARQGSGGSRRGGKSEGTAREGAP